MIHPVSAHPLRIARWALGLLLLLGTTFAAADPARELTWDDLIPKLPPYDDPFKKLTEDQLYDLGDVVYVREQKARGRTVNPTLAERARESEQSLRKGGVDIEGLIAKRAEVRAEREKRAAALNSALDKQAIRLPGYVLPLEFSGTKVREFLLVPWVGACIHTPPPPPNQIVHVRLAQGAEFESKGLYEAMWVNGVLRAESRRTKLSLVDGMADIDVGYGMSGARVEPYRKKP